MIRAACLLALLSLAILVLVDVRLDGATATIFSFLGIPALAATMGTTCPTAAGSAPYATGGFPRIN